MFQNVEIVEEQLDDRSVDDLLSFINGGDGGIGDKGSILDSCIDSLLLFLFFCVGL